MSDGFKVTNLRFSYKDKVILQNVNLNVRQGEFVCLLGESGSGKTTLLHILAGLRKPSGGHISWNGRETQGPSPERSVVFQDYSLFPWLTLRENVSLAARKSLHINKKSANALAEEYLNLVGLSDCFEKYPFELSGGMRQRGAIARALSVGAECLLLDEPFGALDPLNRALLQDLLLEICRGTEQKPMTTIFVTHDIKEAVYLGSRVIVLGASPGRIIAEFPLFFPVNKDREKWFYDTKIQGMVRSIEEAYQQDILAKIGVISQGGSN